MHTNQLKIIGCGGHGKVVIDALSLMNTTLHVSLCDSDPELSGKEVGGLLVASTIEYLPDFGGAVHIAIGSNKTREKIALMKNNTTSLFTIIHPAAIIASSSQVDAGTFIAARAILGPDSIIGACCIINHGAIVDHDVTVGAFSHIAPNSTLGGNAKIGRGVLIGAGAVVLPGITIGDGAIIGAGAVVVKDVKKDTTVMGVPAVGKN